ncbi:hypothetical protein QUF64_16445 [Anaerolineales bacterium HSG6]|nr:hypothetical protein [Anaerolineales bacterium HSG6]
MTRPKPRYTPGDKIAGRYHVHDVKMGGMGELPQLKRVDLLGVDNRETLLAAMPRAWLERVVTEVLPIPRYVANLLA